MHVQQEVIGNIAQSKQQFSIVNKLKLIFDYIKKKNEKVTNISLFEITGIIFR